MIRLAIIFLTLLVFLSRGISATAGSFSDGTTVISQRYFFFLEVHTTTNAYGAIAARKETRQTTVIDDRGKITKTVMDGLQRPTNSTDAFRSALASASQTFYSSTGLVWKSTDPLGRVSESDYDGAARPVASWMPDPITGLVNRTTHGSHPLALSASSLSMTSGHCYGTCCGGGVRWRGFGKIALAGGDPLSSAQRYKRHF